MVDPMLWENYWLGLSTFVHSLVSNLLAQSQHVVKLLPWISGKKSTKISRHDQNSTWIKASLMKLPDMPTMGHLIAEVYNGSFFYYARSWSQTFFPSTTLLNNNLQIFIEAMQWKNKYLRCFQLTQGIKLDTGFDKCDVKGKPDLIPELLPYF
ncbi:putative signal peptide protein [Puccinia sorghi]|uniref:Putative signal peptide protein n=1 Tax=Puccinia sorghi TaxID=27349 RepID=A0A0L6VFJ4_9BASI|nr:putative signal peptide protein [Puccinia sorghi]